MKMLEVIHGYMISQGKKTTELAKEIMMSEPLLSMKLRGKRKLTLDELRLISNSLGITGEDLKRGLQ